MGINQDTPVRPNDEVNKYIFISVNPLSHFILEEMLSQKTVSLSFQNKQRMRQRQQLSHADIFGKF